MTKTVAQRYVELGLQLGRHDESVVDAYFGPAQTVLETLPPAALVEEADALLAALGDGWLRDQITGLRTYAGILAGETISYADEVQGCYGFRPVHTDESVFASAHAQLSELIPGTGSLATRYQSWRESTLVPPSLVGRAMTAVIAEARSQTLSLIDLPSEEGIALEIAEDEPWMAYNFYLGNLRGRVVINNSLPMSPFELLHMAIHETYPGHQAERALKEQLLVRGQGLVEETIVLAPTPQSLITEGIGELAPQMLLDGPGGAAFSTILQSAGISIDLAHSLAVERARQQLQPAVVNAALMLHSSGASASSVQAYLEQWGLIDSEQAGHAVRFMTDPSSRTYVNVYPVGLVLCREYVAGDPARFRRLLTDQIRLTDLLP